MTIRTPRLTLRPAALSDLETTHAYASDPENTKFMMYLPYASIEETAESLREAEAQWRSPSPTRYEFSILLDNRHIGGITLYFLSEPDSAELGWVLSKRHWGNGYVREAAESIMEYARKQLGIRRVIACCDCENLASRRVMEKLGMRCIDRNGTRTNRSTGSMIHVEWTYEILLSEK